MKLPVSFKPCKGLIWFLWTVFNLAGLHGQEAASPLLSSFERYQRLKAESRFGVEWIPLGPTLNSARVEAVQLDPHKPGTMYVAFGSGNLWKTTDHGLHWKAIFENQASLGIGDIALAPSNTDILYVGTGESLKKARNFTMPGTGVYRSDDGGQVWRHLGLEDSWHIGEIAVHPTNPDIVFVAVLGHFWSPNPNRGLYRSLDGGQNWDHVLYLDEHTGANDVVISPSDPNKIYVSMWENYPTIYGINSGIYYSHNGGDSWAKSESGLPSGKRNGRTGLAVSFQNPDRVYALMDNLNNNSRESAEVYKSEDGGLSWLRTHQDKFLIFPGIGWYFTDIYVNPQDDQEIFCLGVRLAHSTDGGKSFEYLGGDVFHMVPSAADHLHLDHCELWINPQNPNQLALGNDGGLYLSYSKGNSWMHYNNIPTGEFYDIHLGPGDPYTIYGGVQDDATVMGPPRAWNPAFSDHWEYLWIDAWSGGDGCFTFVDWEDPHIVYFSLQHGALRRRDQLSGRSVSINPKKVDSLNLMLDFNFVAPYLLSPHNPKTLYLGGNYVLRSQNQGDDWTIISPDLSQSKDTSKKATACGAIMESSLKPGLLYAGTDQGSFWLSSDAGKTWEEHSTGLPSAYIRSIYPSKHKKGRVYIALNGMNYDDLNGYLYVSENHGKKWKAIRQNLPNETANVIVEDPWYEDILYAGMMRGVYVSVDRGAHWDLMDRNFSAATISDLEIHEETKDLIASTHGRGIFRLNLKAIHEAYEMGLTDSKAALFSIDPVHAPYYRDTHWDPEYETLEQMTISFFVPEVCNIKLLIKDQLEEVIWEKDFEAGPGLNQLQWDLIRAQTKSLNPYYIHYDEFIPPGEFQLMLESPFGNAQQTIQILNRD